MYATDYFIRFAPSSEYLQCDLERGYSFSGYQFFQTREDAEEYFEDEDPEQIAEHSDGTFGLALDGLCGFGPYESVEEAEAAIADRGGYGLYDVAGIFTGKYAGQPDDSDGDLFVPKILVKVVQAKGMF